MSDLTALEWIHNLHTSKVEIRSSIIAEEIERERERKRKQKEAQHRETERRFGDIAVLAVRQVIGDLEIKVRQEDAKTYPFVSSPIRVEIRPAQEDHWVELIKQYVSYEELVSYIREKHSPTTYVWDYFMRGRESLYCSEGTPMDNVIKHNLYAKVKEQLIKSDFITSLSVPELYLPKNRTLNMKIGNCVEIRL